jgi:hypothetical protein
MASDEVRILDQIKPELKYHNLAAHLVPAGYALMHIVNHGDFYASPEIMKTCSRDNPLRHPEFPPEIREIMARFLRVFPSICDSIETWEEGFRKDKRPWKEIAIWESWADAAERFTAHIKGDDALSRQKLTEVFAVVQRANDLPRAQLDAIQSGHAHFGNLPTLSASRVREIITWVRSGERAKRRLVRREELRKAIEGPGLPGPSRVPINALFDASGNGVNHDADFDPVDLVNAAEVILGVNIKDEREFLLYGREHLDRIVDSGEAERLNVLRIELDQESDDLERAIALMQTVKGKHDYEGGEE